LRFAIPQSALGNPEPRPLEAKSRFFAIPRFKLRERYREKRSEVRFAIPHPVSQISEAIEKCGGKSLSKLFLPPTSTLFSMLSSFILCYIQ
jgi:hypothetical protein